MHDENDWQGFVRRSVWGLAQRMSPGFYEMAQVIVVTDSQLYETLVGGGVSFIKFTT